MNGNSSKKPRFNAENGVRHLFERHARVIHRYAAAQLGPSVADDIVVEVFTEAWKKLPNFDPAQGTHEVWLIGIAKNKIRRHRRAERRWVRQALAAAEVEGGEARRLETSSDWDVLDGIRSGELGAAMATLSKRDREILLLVSVGDLSVQDASNVIGISEGAGRVLLHRARMRISTVISGGKS